MIPQNRLPGWIRLAIRPKRLALFYVKPYASDPETVVAFDPSLLIRAEVMSIGTVAANKSGLIVLPLESIRMVVRWVMPA